MGVKKKFIVGGLLQILFSSMHRQEVRYCNVGGFSSISEVRSSQSHK